MTIFQDSMNSYIEWMQYIGGLSQATQLHQETGYLINFVKSIMIDHMNSFFDTTNK